MHYVTVLKQDRNSVEFDLIKPGQIRIFKKKQGKKSEKKKIKGQTVLASFE